MSSFPQIGLGAMAQFPLTRSRKWRAILNSLESSEQITLPDTAAGQVEWRLSYQDLTDTEAATLSSLFASSQGSFGAFIFIDPLANLLAWSEDLSQAGWEFGLLQNAPGVTDPLGTERAWSVSNPAAASQALQQTLGMPGEYVACFSVYLRSGAGSGAAGMVGLVRDGAQVNVAVGPAWQRFFVNGTGVAGAVESSFALTVAAGQTIDVWGLQVEAQPYPSVYRQTSAAEGIYAETYFENDELKITSTGPGFSSCQISLMSRV